MKCPRLKSAVFEIGKDTSIFIQGGSKPLIMLGEKLNLIRYKSSVNHNIIKFNFK